MLDIKTAATLLHATEEMAASGADITLDVEQREAIATIRDQAQRTIDRANAGGHANEVIRQTALVKMHAAARVHELVLERSR
ncbi:hypothetical protein PBI_JACE_57 [Gordonia phage Jace]|uniref:Uncharacterized protein n=1 Tax=Gordonia phage Jace TaxID=2182360 RepID=A0A2U8UJ47_9CAUD|nr:hypothetical protein HOT28_gp57 [Gordonia phage Jace]AWN03677.1 hypothetical protein PBI_JACE_57 [Gordonia phage Jace]